VSHHSCAKRIAEAQATLGCSLYRCDNGSDLAPKLPYLLDQPAPGQRQPVKAASRRSRSRGARALTGRRCPAHLAKADQPILPRLRAIFRMFQRDQNERGSRFRWALEHVLALVTLISPGVSGKPPAGDFSRRLVTSTPTTTISTTAGRAFISPSKSSVQRLLHATIFPDSEALHHTSIACDSCARRLITDASVNDGRTVVRPLQTERSASNADDNRTALYAPPTELGMSVSLPIFIQLRKDNGRRRTLCHNRNLRPSLS
jgi:hypothetical protein